MTLALQIICDHPFTYGMGVTGVGFRVRNWHRGEA